MIGHEITHGFDDQGRQYDGNGNAIPWWSSETIEAFTNQAQCFIDQYNNYTIPEIVDIVGLENAHVICHLKIVSNVFEIRFDFSSGQW